MIKELLTKMKKRVVLPRQGKKKAYGVLLSAREGMHSPVYYITFSPFALKR